MGRGKEFAELAHQIIINDHKWSAANVAQAMGMDYNGLYARLCNRTMFSAEEINRLLKVVPDPRFVSHLLRDTPFVAADRTEVGEGEEVFDSMLRMAIRMIGEASDVAECIECALRDGQVDHREAPLILAEIEEAERALANLQRHVRQISSNR